MATHHASAGEVVDLESWAFDVPDAHSKAIAKTAEMELARITLRAGKRWQQHWIAGPVVIHCLSGHAMQGARSSRGSKDRPADAPAGGRAS